MGVVAMQIIRRLNGVEFVDQHNVYDRSYDWKDYHR